MCLPLLKSHTIEITLRPYGQGIRGRVVSWKETKPSTVFRHTGAIKVFEKTGSLLKLQQVMGHSDMKVSLTYLRGLEVKQLDVEDLPEL